MTVKLLFSRIVPGQCRNNWRPPRAPAAGPHKCSLAGLSSVLQPEKPCALSTWPEPTFKSKFSITFTFFLELKMKFNYMGGQSIPPGHAASHIACVRGDDHERLDLDLGVAREGAADQVEVCQVEQRLVLLMLQRPPTQRHQQPTEQSADADHQQQSQCKFRHVT